MATLKWAPLPDGRPWWPAIVVDVNALDSKKHAEAIKFWNEQRAKRGSDPLSKDALILFCGLLGSSSEETDSGHRFAVVPKTSLRSYPIYYQSFANGVVASGKDAGKPCSEIDRKELQRALNQLVDLCKKIPQVQLQQIVLSPRSGGVSPAPSLIAAIQGGSQVPNLTLLAKTKATKVHSEETKEMIKLKKELSNLRRKINSRTAQRTQSASPPASGAGGTAGGGSAITTGITTARGSDSPIMPLTGMDAQLMQQQQLQLQQHMLLQQQQQQGLALGGILEPAVTPEYYPEINSQTLRIWDFCHSFSQELNLTSATIRRPFASLSSFAACLAEPECSLFAQVACCLASYLSVSKGSDADDRWEFNHDNNTLHAKLGSRCSPLTWESLWETLVEKGVVTAPTDPTNKRDILDTLVQACSELECTKSVFSWRLSEFATELSTPLDSQMSHLPSGANQVELRPSYGANPAQLRVLTVDVMACQDLFQVEQTIDALRLEHETLDLETGVVLSRTVELAQAMVWEEKLLARYLSSIRALQLSKRTRSISFGKDHCGRALFTFSGDDDEEECRVWAREDDTDRWFVYRGEATLIKLIGQVTDRETRQVLLTILYASRRRFRPPTVLATRAAKNGGWRFTHNNLLGRKVKKYDIEYGVCPGMVCSWRFFQGRVVYRVVFTKQEWKNGLDMFEEELIHLIACSERLLGDFPLTAAALPPHPYLPPTHYVWHPFPTETLVLVHGPLKKYIGLGVALATSAPLHAEEYDTLVLQDGGEFVTVFGKKNLQEAIRLGLRFSPQGLALAMTEAQQQQQQPKSALEASVTRFSHIERFHPLTHHAGPLVGAQGVAELWGGKIVLENVFELRQPMLASEEAFLRRAPQMWGTDARNGKVWRTFVQNADSVKSIALALECLLDFAARAAAMGQFQTPPSPVPMMMSGMMGIPATGGLMTGMMTGLMPGGLMAPIPGVNPMMAAALQTSLPSLVPPSLPAMFNMPPLSSSSGPSSASTAAPPSGPSSAAPPVPTASIGGSAESTMVGPAPSGVSAARTPESEPEKKEHVLEQKPVSGESEETKSSTAEDVRANANEASPVAEIEKQATAPVSISGSEIQSTHDTVSDDSAAPNDSSTVNASPAGRADESGSRVASVMQDVGTVETSSVGTNQDVPAEDSAAKRQRMMTDGALEDARTDSAEPSKEAQPMALQVESGTAKEVQSSAGQTVGESTTTPPAETSDMATSTSQPPEEASTKPAPGLDVGEGILVTGAAEEESKAPLAAPPSSETPVEQQHPKEESADEGVNKEAAQDLAAKDASEGA